MIHNKDSRSERPKQEEGREKPLGTGGKQNKNINRKEFEEDERGDDNFGYQNVDHDKKDNGVNKDPDKDRGIDTTKRPGRKS